MGNNSSRSTQWSEEPVKPDYPLCGHRQWVWPYKLCTLKPGHGGDHCNRVQAGTQMIDVWWARNKEE